jgi:thymidylate synthase (FAD)
MKILIEDGTFEILEATPNAMQVIERAGRTCYKSEDRITDESAEKFVAMLIERGHESVIEHASATVLFQNHSRGFTHELVRHRLASFSQESTRYVKQDDLHFVMPPVLKQKEYLIGGALYGGFDYVSPEIMVKTLQDFYAALLKAGVPPEDARQFLPIGTSSDIVVTANLREWRHIFRLRCSKKAHWEIRRTMRNLLDEFRKRWKPVFEDVYDEIYKDAKVSDGTDTSGRD